MIVRQSESAMPGWIGAFLVGRQIIRPKAKRRLAVHPGTVRVCPKSATMSAWLLRHADASLGMMLSRGSLSGRLAKAEEDRDKESRKCRRCMRPQLKSQLGGTHPYPRNPKDFPAARVLVTEDGTLIVPMRDPRRNPWHAEDRPDRQQSGKENGLRHARPRGRRAWIGNSHANELICGRVATGLDVAENCDTGFARPAAVVVCFSDGNLVAVAESMRGNRFVFADNDSSGAGEVAAAWKTGLPYAMRSSADESNMDAE